MWYKKVSGLTYKEKQKFAKNCENAVFEPYCPHYFARAHRTREMKYSPCFTVRRFTIEDQEITLEI